MRSRRCFTIYTAICTSCLKKHAKRLTALGMQISGKGTRERTAAAVRKESQRFVEHTRFVSLSRFLSWEFPSYVLKMSAMKWGRGGPEWSYLVHVLDSLKPMQRLLSISAHAVQMQTIPFRQLLTPESSPISSPSWTPGIAQVIAQRV